MCCYFTIVTSENCQESTISYTILFVKKIFSKFRRDGFGDPCLTSKSVLCWCADAAGGGAGLLRQCADCEFRRQQVGEDGMYVYLCQCVPMRFASSPRA